MVPQEAWERAQKEGRSLLRPVPRCPWWPYVWSARTKIKVGTDGRVPIGSETLRIDLPPGSSAVLCSHPSGHYSVLHREPQRDTAPKLLFTNRP